MIAFDENNNADTRSDGDFFWLKLYGAWKLGKWSPSDGSAQGIDLSGYDESAMAFLRHDILEKSLRELGVNEIED